MHIYSHVRMLRTCHIKKHSSGKKPYEQVCSSHLWAAKNLFCFHRVGVGGIALEKKPYVIHFLTRLKNVFVFNAVCMISSLLASPAFFSKSSPKG